MRITKGADRVRLGSDSGPTRVWLGYGAERAGQRTRRYDVMPHLPHAHTHRNEIWNPPKWALSKAVSLPIGEAADRLGVCSKTLNRHADEWGFTVLRRSDSVRYFLISEIDAFIEGGKQLDASAIRRAREGEQNALESISGKKHKRIKTW